MTSCVKGRLVEMFHAAPTKQVKKYILGQMSAGKGHIRMLLCTIAFGMGKTAKGYTEAFTLAH